MTITLKEIGNQIKKYRNSVGLTSDKLAEKSGLTQAFISRVENGQVPGVSLDTIIRISKALNVPVSVLIGESDMTEQAVKALELLRSVLREDQEPKVTRSSNKRKKTA